MSTKRDASFQHFIDAQNLMYERVVAELSLGKKESHWMWFIFPQLSGLGHSSMAEFYALHSLEEARRYAGDKSVGEHLRQCTRLVNDIQGRDVQEIFGQTDSLKFHSSMTLFALAVPGEMLFNKSLTKYFEGKEDAKTVQLLQGSTDWSI
jgi:uncharacterized protein (DUF1810 family)